MVEEGAASGVTVLVAVDGNQTGLPGLAEPCPQPVHLHRPVVVAVQQQETRIDHVPSSRHSAAGQLVGSRNRVLDAHTPVATIAEMVLYDLCHIPQEDQ